MQRFKIGFLVSCLLIVSVNAFAAEPKRASKAHGCPQTDDADGDGYCAAPSTIKPADVAGTGYDCDDNVSSTHPGARDVMNDGVDNDCDGDEFDSPPKAVLKAFGCSETNEVAIKHLVKEIGICEGAAECRLDKVKGKFITDSGFYFLDTNCDGVREVLDEAAKKIRDEEIRKFGDCSKYKPTSHKGKGVYKGKRRAKSRVSATATPSVQLSHDPTATALANAAGAEARQAMEAANAASAKSIDLFGQAQAGLEDLEGQLGKETKAREAGDAALGKRIDVVRGNVDKVAHVAHVAIKEAARSASMAPLVEIGLVGGVVVQSGMPLMSMKTGKHIGIARGFVAPGLGVNFNLGVENLYGRFNGFAVLQQSWDQKSGTESGWDDGVIWQTGVEAAFRLGSSSTYLGPHLLYQQHEAGGNVLGANVASRGVGAGVTFVTTNCDGPVKYGFQARLTGGYEALGTSGKNSKGSFEVVDGGAFFGLQLGVNFGMGASKAPKLKTLVLDPEPVVEKAPAEESEEDESKDEPEPKQK